jgi:hypothetical protein
MTLVVNQDCDAAIYVPPGNTCGLEDVTIEGGAGGLHVAPGAASWSRRLVVRDNKTGVHNHGVFLGPDTKFG